MTTKVEIWPVHPDFSSLGAPIQLSSAVLPGTLLHTVTATADEMDEVWVWAMNTSGSDRTVAITCGGTGMPTRVRTIISADSPPKCLVPGWRLSGGLPIYGYVDAPSVSVMLNINRMLKVVS